MQTIGRMAVLSQHSAYANTLFNVLATSLQLDAVFQQSLQQLSISAQCRCFAVKRTRVIVTAERAEIMAIVVFRGAEILRILQENPLFKQATSIHTRPIPRNETPPPSDSRLVVDAKVIQVIKEKSHLLPDDLQTALLAFAAPIA